MLNRSANGFGGWLLGLAWLIPGALQFIQETSYSRVLGAEKLHVAHTAVLFLPAWLPWIPIASVVSRLALRFRPARSGWLVTLAVHGSALLVAGLVHLSIVGWAQVRFPAPQWPAELIPSSVAAWLKGSFYTYQIQGELLAYGVVVAGSLALEARRREASQSAAALRLETQLSEARLGALRDQLRPHFLFNALNSTLVLVREDPEAAEQMLLRISDLLRRSLDSDDRTFVSLREEISLLRLYLGIEEVRFADRLRVVFDLDEATLDVLVPPWILQPLAENSIRHGIATQRTGGTLRIESQRTPEGGARLAVVDDGAGFSRGVHGEDGLEGHAFEPHASRGLGLDNIKARLHESFHGHARMTVEAPTDDGTRVTLLIPPTLGASRTDEASPHD